MEDELRNTLADLSDQLDSAAKDRTSFGLVWLVVTAILGILIFGSASPDYRASLAELGTSVRQIQWQVDRMSNSLNIMAAHSAGAPTCKTITLDTDSKELWCDGVLIARKQ